MNDHAWEDDEALALEWPIDRPRPAAPVDPDAAPVVLLLASVRGRAALLIGIQLALAGAAVALAANRSGVLGVLLAVIAVALLVPLAWLAPLLGRPHGKVAVHGGTVTIAHPTLRSPLSFELDRVHSVVEGDPPAMRERRWRKVDPAEHVGELPDATPWIVELSARAVDLSPLAFLHRPPDLHLVVVPPVPVHVRVSRPSEARAFALCLAEPGMVDVVLPQVFGHRLVPSLTEDSWAYLLQEDRRFSVDPVEWVRTRVR